MGLLPQIWIIVYIVFPQIWVNVIKEKPEEKSSSAAEKWREGIKNISSS